MSFNIKEQLGWQPSGVDTFNSYLYRINPPLNPSELNLDLLVGNERQILKTPITGHFTFALWYKGYEGAVTSLEERGFDLVVLQVQGGKNRKSYRVSSGIDWVRLFANEVKSVTEHPLSPYQRLILPAPYAIEGLLEEIGRRREDVDSKYIRFAAQAGLKFSQIEQAYIRDIK